ncbi:MAG: GTP-binding protein [Candidatus Lokiarchaeota archaeon]|nr:GTP-binding protein [Candidatus Lokiarchaeota archaeon]
MTKTIKIVIAGEGGVGKTSFLNRIIHDYFDEKSELTKGIEFFNKKIHISLHGEDYDLIFWDFGGQDRFRNFLQDFVDGSSAAIFLFDLTRFNTLDKLEEWLEILTEKESIPILILGTKLDLIDDNTKDYFNDILEKIVDAYDDIFGYQLISSKTSLDVDNALGLIVSKIAEIKNNSARSS